MCMCMAVNTKGCLYQDGAFVVRDLPVFLRLLQLIIFILRVWDATKVVVSKGKESSALADTTSSSCRYSVTL